MKNSTLLLTALLLAVSCSWGQHITVTIAGNGSAAFVGDGVWSKSTGIGRPYDVCTDTMNNLYYTDETNARILKISVQTGAISTVAGGGTSTASGIAATSALLAPRNMCIDASGNIYVVNGQTEIERIDAVTNIITNIAGSAIAGYSGDGGPATAATFKDIFGICTDAAGNIYLVDEENNRVRKITAATGIVTTIAGTGSSGYSGDGGPATAARIYNSSSITTDPLGNVYFMDQTYFYFARFRKIDVVTGIISTIAGDSVGTVPYGMPVLNTYLGKVTGVCRDRHGNFHCNEISCTCRRLDMTTDSSYLECGAIGTESFLDNTNSQLSLMNAPYGICMDASDNLYIADYGNNRIRKLIQLTSTPSFAYGSGEFISACPGITYTLDSSLSITDIDSMQTETFTVLTPPAHGSLSGLPATAVSAAPLSSLTAPSGTGYMAEAGYAGPDSFQVQVSDGTLSSVLTVHISVTGLSVTGANNICSTAPAAYTASISGAAWSVSNASATVSPAGLVTGLSAGTDTIICSATNSCGTLTYNKVVTIVTAPPLTAGVISGTFILGIGATTTLTDPVIGGLWSLTNSSCIILSPGVFQAVSVGADTAIYTITNACGSTAASQAVVVNHSGDGVAIATSSAGIKVYPNPASSMLTIEWGAMPAATASIIITDVAGRKVLSNEVDCSNTGAVQENLSALTDGVYLLKISCGSMHYVDKVVIGK